MLSLIDFLTREECEQVRRTLFQLKPHWKHRMGGVLPFYSLGAASYMDSSAKDDSGYRVLAKKQNPLLKQHFQFVYDRLAQVLQQKMGLEVAYEEELALPGFHIFLAHKMFEEPIASSHFDLQFNSIQWKYQNVDNTHPISFTAAISLPTEGGGLYYWDITQEEAKGLDRDALEQLKTQRERKYLPYDIGKLALHKGLFLHQIAPGKNIRQFESRITLQGHGLVCDDVLRLYW